jgi:hypothetical protein
MPIDHYVKDGLIDPDQMPSYDGVLARAAKLTREKFRHFNKVMGKPAGPNLTERALQHVREHLKKFYATTGVVTSTTEAKARDMTELELIAAVLELSMDDIAGILEERRDDPAAVELSRRLRGDETPMPFPLRYD